MRFVATYCFKLTNFIWHHLCNIALRTKHLHPRSRNYPMKTTPSVFHIAAALAAVALSAGANAIPIAATSATWSNAVGGSGVAYNLSNGSFTDVRWGESLG